MSNNIFIENIKTALESANNVRGHDMERISSTPVRATFLCSYCSMPMQVVSQASVSGKFITGEATIFVCGEQGVDNANIDRNINSTDVVNYHQSSARS